MAVAPLEKAKALVKFGTDALHQMRLEEARKTLKEAVDIAGAAKDPRLQARAIYRLFHALTYQGRMEEARPIVMGALEERFKHGDDEIALLMLQGCALRLMGPGAQDVARLVQDFVKFSTPHAKDPDVARARGQVAVLCNALREQKLAVQLLEGALAVLEATPGSGADAGLMLYNLADLHGALDGYRNLAKIEPMMRRAIALQDAALAPNHPERVAPLMTTGTLLARAGRYEEGRALLERALAIATGIEGADGETPQMVRSALGELESLLLDAKAEPYLLKLVAAAAGAQPLELAARLTALCRHYFACGKAGAAEPHYRKLRAIAEKLDETGQAVLEAEMGVPGKIYVLMRQNQGALAEKLLLGQLETMERVLPRGHDDILHHAYFTGNFYRMNGRHKDALKLFERYTGGLLGRAGAEAALADGLTRLLDAQLELGMKKDAEKTAGEIEKLTGARPRLDPALNEFERQLRSVWHMLGLQSAPDLIGAAQKGDPDAVLVVGLCFAAGQGVPPSLDRARPWFEAAARAGDPVAAQILALLREGKELDFSLEVIAKCAHKWVEKTGAGKIAQR